MAIYPDLKGRVVLLTGGANGIGAATVQAFHGQGATVHFCDVDATAGKALAAALGKTVHFRKVDLRKEDGIVKWIASAGKREGRIDILVNNAARDPRRLTKDTTAKEWDELFATNLRAMFLTCREVTPWMEKHGGSIVNFGSITFHNSPDNMTAYVATKGGVIGFTRALASELGGKRIRVNTLSPGWIMTERQLEEFVTPRIKRMLQAEQCLPDLLQAEDIANIALFLASNSSSAITGQQILADRGWRHN